MIKLKKVIKLLKQNHFKIHKIKETKKILNLILVK